MDTKESENSKKDFSSLGIDEKYCEKLSSHGITEPSSVQSQAIPEIIKGTSLLFQSETGTGKTLAYLLPLLQNVEKLENQKKEVKIVIISPTIELASQIKSQVQMVTDSKSVLLVGKASNRNWRTCPPAGALSSQKTKAGRSGSSGSR